MLALSPPNFLGSPKLWGGFVEAVILEIYGAFVVGLRRLDVSLVGVGKVFAFSDYFFASSTLEAAAIFAFNCSTFDVPSSSGLFPKTFGYDGSDFLI